MTMENYTVIPAARGYKDLDFALASDCKTIFLLDGELIHLKSIMQSVRRAGKKLFLHIELLEGIKEDEASSADPIRKRYRSLMVAFHLHAMLYANAGAYK